MNQASPVPIISQSPGGLLTELDLGSGVGGRRKPEPLEIELIRSLTPSDLAAIQHPPAGTAIIPMVRQLRHSHHRLAELVAAGRPPAEIAIITGYSPSYISGLKGDPAFNELIAYYEFQKREIFADAMERLKLLGLDAVEHLHARLNDPEKTWSNKELMDLVEMSLVAPAQAKPIPGQGGSISSANLSLEVKFVGASPRDGQIIDAQFSETTPKQQSDS